MVYSLTSKHIHWASKYRLIDKKLRIITEIIPANFEALIELNKFMETTQNISTITGKKIFFNFFEVPFDKLSESGDLIRKLKNGEVHGFVLKNLFSKEEISEILRAIERPLQEKAMVTPYGKMFPAPFAIITNSTDRLNAYYESVNAIHELMERVPVVKLVRERVENFFKTVGKDFKVSVPINKTKKLPVSEGSFRVFYKDKGALFVHCGNLFQQQSEFYYSQLANDIDMNDQLSFFFSLQNTEVGGELTIYKMLWKDVVGKATPEENESVIDAKGNTIYLKDVEQFSVKPQPGDILVFAGGPIWHRVEDIKGETPRITYGGFVNFSPDGRELFYWS